MLTDARADAPLSRECESISGTHFPSDPHSHFSPTTCSLARGLSMITRPNPLCWFGTILTYWHTVPPFLMHPQLEIPLQCTLHASLAPQLPHPPALLPPSVHLRQPSHLPPLNVLAFQNLCKLKHVHKTSKLGEIIPHLEACSLPITYFRQHLFPDRDDK